MSDPLISPVIVAVALAAALALGVLAGAAIAARAGRRERRRAAELEARLDDLQRQISERNAAPARTESHRSDSAPGGSDDEVNIITRLGQDTVETSTRETRPAVRLSGPAFADVLMRETAVRTVSAAHGVRRALRAESIDRVRLEMRREMRRRRKARKVEVKEALREYRARHRRDVAPDTQPDTDPQADTRAVPAGHAAASTAGSMR